MQPFLLVKLPDFVFDIINKSIIDVHKQSRVAAERGGETPEGRTLSLNTFSSDVTDTFNVTLTVKLAHTRDFSF